MGGLGKGFYSWLYDERNGRGARYLYHTGLLMKDRVTYLTVNGETMLVNREPIHSVASTVWKAAKDAKVALVQKKVAPFEYEYWAVML